MFNKINSRNLPLPVGLTVDAFSKFFTSMFMFQTSDARDDFKKSNTSLMANQHYLYLWAITVPSFDVQDPSKLNQFIVGAALFMYDNKRESFVNWCLGVTYPVHPPQQSFF
jgi:hypothetical protein